MHTDRFYNGGIHTDRSRSARRVATHEHTRAFTADPDSREVYRAENLSTAALRSLASACFTCRLSCSPCSDDTVLLYW